MVSGTSAVVLISLKIASESDRSIADVGIAAESTSVGIEENPTVGTVEEMKSNVSWTLSVVKLGEVVVESIVGDVDEVIVSLSATAK